MIQPIQVDTELRSTDERWPRVVRVIEVERGPTGGIRRLHVENVESGRRTVLTYPLRGRWIRGTRDPS